MSDRLSLELEPADTLRLANLCGQFDAHLKQIESRVGVEIFCRGNLFTIQGPERASRAARRLLINLYRLAENEVLTPDLVNLHLQESGVAELEGGEGIVEVEDEVLAQIREDDDALLRFGHHDQRAERNRDQSNDRDDRAFVVLEKRVHLTVLPAAWA